MNIFVTDSNPVKSAMNLDDKRVIKMILESTQMLCTAINELGGTSPYKSTHVNHPCNVWVRQSKANWVWLSCHATALCFEYTLRYNKKHKCEDILEDINRYVSLLPDGLLTPFANCAAHKGLGLDYKHIQPVTEAYKAYLNKRWETDKRSPMWTGRGRPEWCNV